VSHANTAANPKDEHDLTSATSAERTTKSALRVLVVEDSPLVRERLVSMIAGLGLDIGVIAVGNGEAALQLCRKQPPHVVVLDIDLPGLNGFDLLAQLKIEQPALRIIMLTIYTFAEFRANATRLGADHFLCKTTEFERVSEILKSMAAHRLPLPA
jgi:DNA-binding NarL/FixJ family response regulator